ncbi:MAG: mRNA-degrading endonuclease [Candidatus Lloydbacteria bacterium RIFCSPHIGHO2_02_FULL_54_17]|uniref:mRNA-degrading endonuclease n=1 Tax=Candidatus Lloydbacteria bacterium RIFCSPHIGHO2_02_FULL_54_17 TaxID=1798664 RepID=A0A1G2DE17_9BACT|nr:MAG: mRNA-degrading endonuclease [Candidatus Lloydbacteria bacterium RIFCSPHIGHO2_01_FULL_54_11]OGZ11783.1 MAG: mRNA-degrading endonuclease [Candidatus Lloydbacteria bacterium RIFCSPHIGHO2_02_FULL_54_17]OGZ14312.1 MAG: mRNA-degrading endonuclease [Candidatus Lloydbacteria bacterium RIFCSPLOWO2_01_FULL_54_18]OGZ16020.1 MAG: mRNA-degrading endonuclease [Candidatus Lloydbacteria bacterium RIFCSPLOWO2_02_FULL_54_12]
MVKTKYIPDRGDIVWLDLNPAKGHEQKGVRPAFVVSPKLYNAKTGLALMCPVTSASKGYSFEVALNFSRTIGVVLADHVRSLDWKARNARYIETVSDAITDEVEAKLRTLIVR